MPAPKPSIRSPRRILRPRLRIAAGLIGGLMATACNSTPSRPNEARPSTPRTESANSSALPSSDGSARARRDARDELAVEPPKIRPATRPPAMDRNLGLGLGRPASEVRVPAAARKHHRAGLRAHRKRNYAKARAAFGRALQRAPQYDVARFDLARASSRLGDHAKAETELKRLLERDLPRFGPRLREDPDLEAFRKHPAGAALLATLPARTRRWKAVLAAGLPVVEHVSAKTRVEGDDPPRLASPERLRAGVLWWNSSKTGRLAEVRFVPAGPVLSEHRAVAITDAGSRVNAIAATAEAEPNGDLWRARIDTGDTATRALDRGQPLSDSAKALRAIDLRVDGGRASPQIHPGHEEAPDTSLSVHAPPRRGEWLLRVLPEGSLLLSRANAATVPPARWPAHDREARFRSVERIGDAIYLGATWHGCRIDAKGQVQTSELRHHLSRLGTDAKASSTVAEGPGAVSMRRDAEGGLWVQTGSRLHRIPPGSTSLLPIPAIAARYLLHVPLGPRSCARP